MNKRILTALTMVFTGASAFLFNCFCMEAKNTAITKLNEEQMIHAKQAARGIEDFFATWTRPFRQWATRLSLILKPIGAMGLEF